jgi:predicted kinase
MNRSQSSQKIFLPQRTLLVLCGPAGSGKSTFAHAFVDRHRALGLRRTTIVSSDHCRALICDDESNQHINGQTFELFHLILDRRMEQSRFSIADSTALQAEARKRLLEQAQRHEYTTCLCVFNMSLHTCIENDQRTARGRIVGKDVIAYHVGLLAQAMQSIPDEGWDNVIVLNERYRAKNLTIAIL